VRIISRPIISYSLTGYSILWSSPIFTSRWHRPKEVIIIWSKDSESIVIHFDGTWLFDLYGLAVISMKKLKVWTATTTNNNNNNTPFYSPLHNLRPSQRCITIKPTENARHSILCNDNIIVNEGTKKQNKKEL